MEPDLVKVKPSFNSKLSGDCDHQTNLEEVDTKDAEDVLSIKPMGPLNIQDTPNYGLFTSSLLLDTKQQQQQDHRRHRRHHHHNHYYYYYHNQNNNERGCFTNNLELDHSDQKLESKHTLQSIDQHISPQRDETCLKLVSKSHHKSLKGSFKNKQSSIKPWMERMEKMEMIERKPGQLNDSFEDDSSSNSSRSCDTSPTSSSTSSSSCSFPDDKCNPLLNKESHKYNLNENRFKEMTPSCSSSIMQPSSRKVSKGSSSLQIKQYTLSASPSAKSYFYRNQPNSYDLPSTYIDQYRYCNKPQKFKPIYSSSLSDTEYHQRQFASSRYHKNNVSSHQFALGKNNFDQTSTLLVGYEIEKKKGHRVLETNTLTRFENKKRISNQPQVGTIKSFYCKNYDVFESKVKSGAANLEVDYQKSKADKERDCYTSALSLVSNSTTFSNRVQNRHSLEIQNLKRDLDTANEKVAYLTSQLNTNSHMVTAFEQSLSSMTSRLQHLTNLSQVKDYELTQLKSTIDDLSHNNNSCTANIDTCIQKGDKKLSLVRRHTLTSQSTSSKDSKSGLKSSFTSQVSASIKRFKEKKKTFKGTESIDTESDSEMNLSKGWIRSSLSKAFRKAKAGVKYHGSISENYHQNIRDRLNGLKTSSLSVPNSPIMPNKLSCEKIEDHMEGRMVEHLKQKLSEKEKELIDLRLEALTAAHQLDNFKEVVNKLQSEMITLKKDNQRLERIIVEKSLHTAKSYKTASSSSSLLTSQPAQKKIMIYITSFKISTITVTSCTSWQLIEQLIKKCIQNFLHRIDLDHNLGLKLEHFDSYQIGKEKTTRSLVTDTDLPSQLLPFNYLLDKPKVSVRLSSDLNSLTFETLILKTVLEKIIALLKEQKRLIIYGPSGTGKSYLAQKLAQYLVKTIKHEDKQNHQTADRTCPSFQNSIVSFNIGPKTGNELEYISKQVATQAESQTLPLVIILDNLYQISSLEEILKHNLFVNKDDNQRNFYIIVTLRLTNLVPESLELSQNFNWLMYNNHEEPVKGFLSKFLKRKLIKTETEEAFKREVVDSSNADMIKIIDWIVSLWNYVNNFLEVNHSPEVTLGPEIFTSCPTKIDAFEKWLSHLWNQSLCPYLIQAVKEGVEKTGLRLRFEDPTEWIFKTYPLPNSQDFVLQHINLEDIKPSTDESLTSPFCDKLSEMLIKLKISANINDDKEVQSHKSNR